MVANINKKNFLIICLALWIKIKKIKLKNEASL